MTIGDEGSEDDGEEDEEDACPSVGAGRGRSPGGEIKRSPMGEREGRGHHGHVHDGVVAYGTGCGADEDDG